MVVHGGRGGGGGSKTVGRWSKGVKDKKKEETRAHNAQLHAAVFVDAVVVVVAAIAAAIAASAGSGKHEKIVKTVTAVASFTTLVASQCLEIAEVMGAERDIMTLTAAAFATG